MIVGVVVLGVLCVGVSAWALMLMSSGGKARARVTELEAEVAAGVEAVDAERRRADGAEAAKLSAEAAASTAARRADDAAKKTKVAEAQANAAADRAKSAESRAADAGRTAAEAAAAAEQARQQADAARDEAATALEHTSAAERAAIEAKDLADAAEREATEARTRAEAAEAERDQMVRLSHPDGAWALDHLRLERLWHDRLSLPGEDSSPLAPLDDPTRVESPALRSAVHVLTEASREETGVVIDLEWGIAEALPPALASAVVRLAEELVAAAREADGGQLDVRLDDRDVVLRLSTEPAIEMPGALEDAVNRFSWPLTIAGDAIEARIPLADTAD